MILESQYLKAHDNLESDLNYLVNHGIQLQAEDYINSDISFKASHAVRLEVSDQLESSINYFMNHALPLESKHNIVSDLDFDIQEAYYLKVNSNITSDMNYILDRGIELYAQNASAAVIGRLAYALDNSLPLKAKHNIQSSLDFITSQNLTIYAKNNLASDINYVTDQPAVLEGYMEIGSDISYEYEPPSYRVRFYVDGSLWASQTVYHGESASQPSNPSRSGTGYVFDGWDKSFSNITEETDIHATWTTTRHPRPTMSEQSVSPSHSSIRVLVDNQNSNGHLGARLQIRHPETNSWFSVYTGSSRVTRQRTFTGLDPDTSYTVQSRNTSTVDGYTNSLTRSITITTDPLPTYMVYFYDFDDNVISSQEVELGDDASAPSDPDTGNNCTYFDGWDRSYTNIESNTHVLPTYDYYTYTVTWEDHNGTTIRQRTLNCGTWLSTSHSDWPDHPDSRRSSGYEPDGWSSTGFSLTSNTTVTAEYKIKTYRVRFYDFDNQTILHEEYVDHGQDATPPSDPETPNSYTYFDGWDKSYTNITSQTYLYAQYAYHYYTVRWQDFNGAQVYQRSVRGGTYMNSAYEHWPSHPDSREDYIPDGWSPIGFTLTGTEIIVAQYKYKYTVEWQDNSNVGSSEYNSTDNVCSEMHHEGNVTRDLRWSETGNTDFQEPEGAHVSNTLPNPNNYEPGYIIWLRDTSQGINIYIEHEVEIRAYRKCTKVEI